MNQKREREWARGRREGEREEGERERERERKEKGKENKSHTVHVPLLLSTSCGLSGEFLGSVIIHSKLSPPVVFFCPLGKTAWMVKTPGSVHLSPGSRPGPSMYDLNGDAIFEFSSMLTLYGALATFCLKRMSKKTKKKKIELN
jgi:hypothetical protein